MTYDVLIVRRRDAGTDPPSPIAGVLTDLGVAFWTGKRWVGHSGKRFGLRQPVWWVDMPIGVTLPPLTNQDVWLATSGDQRHARAIERVRAVMTDLDQALARSATQVTPPVDK